MAIEIHLPDIGADSADVTEILVNVGDAIEVDSPLISVEGDKAAMVEPARVLVMLGFKILATAGTATVFEDAGVPVTRVNKVFEGRPHIVDLMKNGEVQLIFNTTEGRQSHLDSYSIRRTALDMRIPCYTTASAARAAILSLRRIDEGALEPVALQTYS